ncbi:MAG TPA: hypothetical protein VN632_09945 [Stellaceae bacterium]|nr:hypothetical protein [Stellaceae bacterium]
MNRVLTILAIGGSVAACAATAPTMSHAQAADMNRVHAACAALGLNPHEAPYFGCIRSLEASLPARPVAMAAAAPAGTIEGACAAIGIDPNTARFSYCVGNLRQTLDDANNIGAR